MKRVISRYGVIISTTPGNITKSVEVVIWYFCNYVVPEVMMRFQAFPLKKNYKHFSAHLKEHMYTSPVCSTAHITTPEDTASYHSAGAKLAGNMNALK